MERRTALSHLNNKRKETNNEKKTRKKRDK